MSIELKEKHVLLHGIFPELFFKELAKHNVKQAIVLEARPNSESLHSSVKSLRKQGILPIIIADNMPGFLFKRGLVQEVWLACQPADKKGALCSIGALILAVLGKAHGIPVYNYPVDCKNQLLGKPKELLSFNGIRVAPPRIKAYVPLFERVAQKYLTSEKGIHA